MNSVQEIERAIDELKPQERAELYAWLDRNRRPEIEDEATSVFEEGLGLFGKPEDASILDEVVGLAYEERRRPSTTN